METEKVVQTSLDHIIWADLPQFMDQTVRESPLEVMATGRDPFAPRRPANWATEVVSARRLPLLDQPVKTKIAPAVSPVVDTRPEDFDADCQRWFADQRAHQRPAPRPDLVLIETCRQADQPLPSPPWLILGDVLVFFGTALALGGFACLAHLHWG